MRPLLHASTKAIASLYNYRLLANMSSDPIPKTIDNVIQEVGEAILRPGDLNMPIWGIEAELFSKLLFAYLNE